MKLRFAAIALLAFTGMVDALYLSFKRNAGPIPCHITHGCTDVLTSKYSAIAGIPLSWFGLAFYIVMFSMVIVRLFEDPEHPLERLSSVIFYLAGTALIISAFLVGIQAFILKAFCEYCLLSAGLALTIFLLAPHPGQRKLPA
jgi:uncharacterized membrane protein